MRLARALLGLLVACGSTYGATSDAPSGDAGADDGGGTITLGIDPPTITLRAGGAAASLQVDAQRTIRGGVSVTVSNLPAGVSGAPAAIPDDQTSTTIQLLAAASAPPADVEALVVASAGTLTASQPVRVVVQPPPGAVDMAYGSNGVSLVSEPFIPLGYAIAPDAKLVAVGCTPGVTNVDSVVSRVNADGTLDTTFGKQGLVVTTVDASGADCYAAAVVLDDRRIVVTGNGPNVATLGRYLESGAPDPSLPPAKYGTTSPGPGSITVANDGSYFAAAEVNAGSANQIQVAHFAEAAKPVTTTTNFGGFAAPRGIVMTADGNAMVGAYIEDATSGFSILRFTPSPALDPTFGSGGRVSVPVGGAKVPLSTKIASFPDGRLVGAGSVSNSRFAVVRVTAAGSPDATFGAGGIAQIDTPFTFYPAVLAATPDGAVLLAGFDNASKRLSVVRVLVNGNIDTTFGTNGYGGVTIAATAVLSEAFVHDGKLVIAGSNSDNAALLSVRFWL